MSRVGKLPIPLAKGVSTKIEGGVFYAESQKGKMSLKIYNGLKVDIQEEQILVSSKSTDSAMVKFVGTFRSLINNIILGLSEGFTKSLEMKGVGYRAAIANNVLTMNLGFSHDIVFNVPEGISITCPDPQHIVVSGFDKQLVGQVAANIRSYRPPEPYKGKGVKYDGEYIFRKEGKKK